ncbi:MAG: hypothetical protein SF182_12485 [Deltaproteobacteria bacterium]|nr:hypothetical protein [Deltaproteobacteria bacterium]
MSAPLRARLAASVLALAVNACTSGPGPAPDAPAATASILAEPDAYVDRVDGVRLTRRPRNAPEPLTPGTHQIVLRRRTTAASSYNGRPPDYPVLAGRDEANRAVFLSDTTCTVALPVAAGARYTARVASGSEPTAWSGTISGPNGEVGCAAETRVPRGLLGQSRFLCCTMAFKGGKATDANYRYDGWRTEMLPAGTPVKVTGVGRDRATIETAAGASYTLYLEYGNATLDTDAYFNALLPASDPTAGLSDAMRAAVHSGSLAVGMTRAQAIAVRGYPPRHKTAELEQMQWYYYDSPGRGVYVTFVGDAVSELHPGSPP